MGKGASDRRPLGLGGPELIIAIDNAAFEELAPRVREHLARESTPLRCRVVRASELADPNTDADLYLGAYSPTTPDCELILDYVEEQRFEHFEQDRRTGAVFRGRRLVWPSAPLAVTNLEGEDLLRAGADAALFFAEGPQVRITTVPNVFAVVRQFRTRAPNRDERVLPDWIDRARTALATDGESGQPN